jgi:hypothetical protein
MPLNYESINELTHWARDIMIQSPNIAALGTLGDISDPNHSTSDETFLGLLSRIYQGPLSVVQVSNYYCVQGEHLKVK